MSWSEKQEVKKGTIGENIVQSELEKRGYVVFKAVTKKAHAFDFLAVKDKQIFVIAEIKSKARLNKFNATGIDKRHYEEYIYIYNNQGIDVILFFVDEHPKEERIYCQVLTELMKPTVYDDVCYPNHTIAKGIILFPLDIMKEVCKLDAFQLEELRKHSRRSYGYI